MKKKNIAIGSKFGRLSYLGDLPSKKGARRKGVFRCDCGNEVAVFMGNIARGTTQSCGCLQKELTRERSVTHGMTKTHEYRCWQAMKQRCYYKKHKSYPVYGGAGITVCDRWRDSFENFLEDMGPIVAERTLDRVAGATEYNKANCRWATVMEQANNRRTNVPVTISGVTKNMAEWARVAGISRALFRYRLTHGWHGEDLLLKPTK